jgi:hypothetical protein
LCTQIGFGQRGTAFFSSSEDVNVFASGQVFPHLPLPVETHNEQVKQLPAKPEYCHWRPARVDEGGSDFRERWKANVGSSGAKRRPNG